MILIAYWLKFTSHPSVMKMKQNFNGSEKFTFLEVTLHEVERNVKELLKNKAASGDISLKVLKESNFSFEKLRNCINYAFSSGKFPDSPNIENKQSRGGGGGGGGIPHYNEHPKAQYEYYFKMV